MNCKPQTIIFIYFFHISPLLVGGIDKAEQSWLLWRRAHRSLLSLSSPSIISSHLPPLDPPLLGHGMGQSPVGKQKKKKRKTLFAFRAFRR